LIDLSVVIPAHNEARVIGRLLERLLATALPGEFEVIVVCNGCTDETAALARSHGPDVQVIETPVASKKHALKLGDDVASRFPRLYVDADIELDAESARALAQAVAEPGILAAGPTRVVPRKAVSAPVRWYYDVWERLPVVQSSLFGRGVIAVSETGHVRLSELPPSMADDLVASEAFDESERRVVPEAIVVVHPPRTMTDLLRRRVRLVTGNLQAREAGLSSPDSRTSTGDLARVVAHHPASLPGAIVLVAVAVIARRRARRLSTTDAGDVWERDESSRT